MKRFWLGTAIIGMLTLTAGTAGCAGGGSGPSLVGTASGLAVNLNQQQTGIWVTGHGEILVTPDIASVTLGISSQARRVADAQSAAATAMDKVMTALTQAGVAKKDIQTQQFSIQQVTRFDRDRQEETVVGYRVTNMVVATIRELNKAGSIIDAVVVAGGELTRVNSIGFSVENPSRYYSEIRQKAMADANAKAKQLAQEGGVALGKPTFISESLVYPQPRPVFEARLAVPAPAPALPPTSVSPGEMKITLNIQVVYAIQS